MSIAVNHGLVPPDQTVTEVVERKGLGHPDTLVDGIVEAAAIAYATHCRERFGVIPHHNFDKAALMGGLCVQDFGGGSYTAPIRMLFMGRASRSFAREPIPLADLQASAAKAYLARVLPHLDTDDPNIYEVNTLTSMHSTRPFWFAPRSVQDLPEYDSDGPLANDTATMVSYWPLTLTERLALQLEGYFYMDNNVGLPVPRFDYIGQDIKVTCVRHGDRITATLCIPQIATRTADTTVYCEREREIEGNLQRYADELAGDRSAITVQVNTHTKKTGRPYLVTGGSCIDFGEEGAVGRGNKTHGIIASFRPNTMEAPQGKNPTYFVGKVLGYLADRIAMGIFSELQIPCQVALQANMGDYLFAPAEVDVTTERAVSPRDVERIVADCLSLGRETTNRILDEAYFLPRTSSWKPHAK